MIKNMENKMNENQEHIEMIMKEFKKSMYDMFLHTLKERLPKGYKKMQGNHENIEEIKIES
jgi:hypothetical protein